MLEGLEQIAWTDLHHAYGPAADVPKLLHDLISINQKVRSAAIATLHGNIWHQGTVYEATAFAVPFLLELLEAASTPSRPSIANLLALIARGRSFHEVHAPLKKKAVERELAWVRAAHVAVQEGLGTALHLLRDEDCDLRLAAVHLLACFPENASRSCPALMALLDRDEHDRARGAAGLALALLGRFEPSAFESRATPTVPIDRLADLAAALTEGECDRDDGLDILLDLATDSFEEECLDDFDAQDDE